MLSDGPKISSICYSLGQVRPISALLDLGLADQGALDALAAKGLRNFCEDSRSTGHMCTSCVEESLSESGLRAADIDAVVIGPSQVEWNLKDEQDLLSALASIGISRAKIYGISMQACSVGNAALDLARILIVGSSKVRNVLVIIFGRSHDGNRLGPSASTLYSDGSASCIVSADFGVLKIIACASVTDLELAGMEQLEANFKRYLQSGMVSLNQVCKEVYSQAQVAPPDIAAVFGTNGSNVYLQMIGFASGVAANRVWKENLSRYAHVYGCDGLIGLRDRMLQQDFGSGEYVMSVAWAPNVASACLLRRV
jgi:3-oxoacyl-[acyl-carrier-protein] synthase-3